jgi:Tfp pilus assembly protein PilV
MVIQTHITTSRRGISLIETMISMLIVAIMVVAVMQTLGTSAMARRTQASQRRGPALARQLMAEILPNRYCEPDDTAQFGREAGESAASRVNYDDVDDYNGWSASSPEGPDNTVLSDLDGWTRSAVVQYVDPDDLTTVVSSDQGVKRITVTVTDPQGRQFALSAIRSSNGVYDHPPTTDTTYVSWVGLELQIGDDEETRVITGANPANRVPVGGQ